MISISDMNISYSSIIAIFLIGLFFISFYPKSIQAENTNGVEIQNVQIQPSVVKNGDIFSISATLVNNSTNPIYVETNDCTGILSVIFDNHVKVDTKISACTYTLTEHILNPGEKFTGTNPPSGVTYTANATGTANGTVTFSYGIRNQTDPNSSTIEKTISKSLLFTIYGNNSKVTAINEMPLSPLEQFKSGIAAKNVVCADGFTLVIKAEDGSPACVKPTTVNILIERGWAKPI